MDIKGKFIDISSFLLFEATGDSETGCIDPAMSVVVVDDDDAESCSCDTTPEFLPGVRELSGLEHKASVDDDEEGEVVELQKEDALHKICRDEYDHRRFNGVGKGEKSSPVSVDSTETLNQKNRLFWESCLAS
ncbi:RNA-binding protein-defense related 1 isoform 1 [Hibiscus syriacus]|uniref:RNA-binding protein-defense related 1 isoform 1 n=1 Tax=Hibiscus syriacus TaxID=106335 RepID=A0A6A3AIA1_HIBSY|nr:RNA-binding protein-defense related 1 isoform 1 [Hibiscus syriacus]